MRFLSALMRCAAGIAVAFAVDADEVVRDTRFNHGDFRVDAFGAAFTEYPRGQRILTLPDGDLVVAAVVPLPGGSPYTVGLTRYGTDGTPRPWPVPNHPLTRRSRNAARRVRTASTRRAVLTQPADRGVAASCMLRFAPVFSGASAPWT